MERLTFDMLWEVYTRSHIDVKLKMHKCDPYLRKGLSKDLTYRLLQNKSVHYSSIVKDITRGRYGVPRLRWVSNQFHFESRRFTNVIVLKTTNMRTGVIKETWTCCNS